MFDIYSSIERRARNAPPNLLTPLAKKIIAYPRYYSQLSKCKAQYLQYKDHYDQNVLFVFGLPKSGTTWFEKMLSSFPGFSNLMIPEAVAFEQKHGQSHTFQLPDNLFSRFDNALVVLKLHAHGSLHNHEVLKKNNLKYVVIFRDLRDVAVSHIFYVKRTAYHPEFRMYKKLNTKEALLYFAKTLLPQFIQWIDSWNQFSDSPLNYLLRYEDLVAQPFQKMEEVVKHYGISTNDEKLKSIIDKNNFENLSGGREKGNENPSSFFRSGTCGSWRKYFDDELTAVYTNILAPFLVKHNYDRTK